VLVLLLAVAVVTPHTTPFLLLLVTRILILAILAMSLDLLLGFTGIASLGHAAFLGLGAYLTAILAVRYNFGLGWDFALVILFGSLLGAATAAVFGLFALRASGVYFLMITLALSQCVWGLAYRWDTLTGGDNGLNLPGRPVLGPIQLGNDAAYFYVVFAFFAVSLLALYVLVESPFGKSLVGIREHEVRMRILGYNTWLHKYIAFIVSGAFGGLAGVLWAQVSGQVSPDNVTLTTSVDALLMVVLGGPGTLLGGVLGARDVARRQIGLRVLQIATQARVSTLYHLLRVTRETGKVTHFRSFEVMTTGRLDRRHHGDRSVDDVPPVAAGRLHPDDHGLAFHEGA